MTTNILNTSTTTNSSITFLTLAYLLTIFFHAQHSQCFSTSSTNTLFLPLKTQRISSGSVPRSPNKLPFHHNNVSLTVSLTVGSPPQNITMVIDTGSELSWLHSNKTQNNSQTNFDPSRSSSYSPVPCSSPTCTNRTRDFPIPVHCDSNNLCHATLSYADSTSTEGTLASDKFHVGFSELPGLVFGCMDSISTNEPDQDLKNTGLMGMNRGSLSFISQMELPKFSYCISGSDFSGLLLFGDANLTWLKPLNYTPLVELSTPLPYFDRVAYTVQLEGIKISGDPLPIPEYLFKPDHTGAGQTMVDSGTQFTYLLGPVYSILRSEFLNRTKGVLRVLEEENFVFEGAFDLCYRVGPDERDMTKIPSVSLVFRGAEMSVSGEMLLYRVPGEMRGSDSVYCFTFGNSELLGVEAFVIGHQHQQNVWMEFDLEKSRIGLAQVQCDLAVQRLNMNV